MFDNGGIQRQDTATLMVNSYQKLALSEIYTVGMGFQESTRNVGGVAVDTIITDFGTLNVMTNRHMPADTIALLSLEQLAPRFLFIEPVAKDGSSDKFQIYGEIGLFYGNERAHGKITGLKTA